jgi:hypothetical protein
MIQHVSAYRTSDGELFTDMQLAETHEKSLCLDYAKEDLRYAIRYLKVAKKRMHNLKHGNGEFRSLWMDNQLSGAKRDELQRKLQLDVNKERVHVKLRMRKLEYAKQTIKRVKKAK